LIREDLRESQEDGELKSSLVDKVVNEFLYIYVARIAFRRMNYEMAFAVYLKVPCPPVLHTIGLNDLFQCDVLHLSPSLHVIPCEEVQHVYKPFNLSDYYMPVKNFFLEQVNQSTPICLDN
jgi:hypothetical protein